jgi:hypothetical protein
MACAGIPLSDPPADCHGVVIEDIDIRTVPSAHTYRNGTVVTNAVRLTGHWNGGVLKLVSQPAAAANSAVTPVPTSCPENDRTSDPAPALLATQQQLWADEASFRQQGVRLIASNPCSTYIQLVVAVADSRTVDLIQRKHEHLRVVGWFVPA